MSLVTCHTSCVPFLSLFSSYFLQNYLVKESEGFETYFPDINIVKAYTKVLNRNIEEGKFMINHAGEVLNSKTEWNQPRIIRTTNLQGGAEMLGGGMLHAPRA